MEARIGKLLQHKVGDVGAIDAQSASGKSVGQDVIVAGKGTVHQPGRPDNGVIDIAGCQQTLLRGLVDERVLQRCLPGYPDSHRCERVLIFAPIGLKSRGAQYDQPGDVFLTHSFEDMGDRPDQHIGLLGGAGSKCGEDGSVAVHGVYNCAKIEHIAFDHSQMRVGRHAFGITGECGDRVPLRQRLRHDQPACSPSGAEDNDLHVNPVASFPLVSNHHTIQGTTLLQCTHLSSERISANMSENLKQTEDTLRDLIETLRDGHQGFIELEKNLKDPEARQLFREQILERAGFAAELENELHHFGVKDVKVGSSTAGKVHRAWGELKARLGGGDHALLATAEKGEDEAKHAYEEALASEDFPLPLREMLLRQQRHILAAHDRVKALRDRQVK
jgi:uncharacterized protein (TIGR02284 family)